MSETLNHVLVSSTHERHVLRSKSSRWRGADDTRIFRTNSYFRMCKEFYAPFFILFISNYLYLSLIIRAPRHCRIFALETRRYSRSGYLKQALVSTRLIVSLHQIKQSTGQHWQLIISGPENYYQPNP